MKYWAVILMDLNDLIIAVHESDMLENQKNALYGALQELAQYRNNPLLQLKPCWKYVRQNNIHQQLEHVMSECVEVEEAITLEEIASEWVDIFQSAYTGLIILQVKYGQDIGELIRANIIKNTEREGGSYYE